MAVPLCVPDLRQWDRVLGAPACSAVCAPMADGILATACSHQRGGGGSRGVLGPGQTRARPNGFD